MCQDPGIESANARGRKTALRTMAPVHFDCCGCCKNPLAWWAGFSTVTRNTALTPVRHMGIKLMVCEVIVLKAREFLMSDFVIRAFRDSRG
jgi:hypothetical protein